MYYVKGTLLGSVKSTSPRFQKTVSGFPSFWEIKRFWSLHSLYYLNYTQGSGIAFYSRTMFVIQLERALQD